MKRSMRTGDTRSQPDQEKCVLEDHEDHEGGPHFLILLVCLVLL